MYNFCTILERNYLPYAIALKESLVEQNPEVMLYIFIVEDGPLHDKNDKNITYLNNDSICKAGLGKALYDKYFVNQRSAFRWSIKSVLLKYLLAKGAKKAICIDCDIHFYSSYNFLFDELDKYRVLLTPHNRAADPSQDPNNFERNFMEGIFNAGFFGAADGSEEILDWWANACLYRCDFDYEAGTFCDQKYLDFIPARFEKVLSVKHPGCNVAEWNIMDCKRSLVDGKVKINAVFDVVFIHFVAQTFIKILNGQDELLLPHAHIYNNRLMSAGLKSDLIKHYELICRPELFEQLSRKVWLKNRVKRVFSIITFSNNKKAKKK